MGYVLGEKVLYNDQEVTITGFKLVENGVRITGIKNRHSGSIIGYDFDENGKPLKEPFKDLKDTSYFTSISNIKKIEIMAKKHVKDLKYPDFVEINSLAEYNMFPANTFVSYSSEAKYYLVEENGKSNTLYKGTSFDKVPYKHYTMKDLIFDIKSVKSLKEQAIERYPIGTRYNDRGTVYTVESLNWEESGISDMIFGESGKGCFYYKGKWAEIISKSDVNHPDKSMVTSKFEVGKWYKIKQTKLAYRRCSNSKLDGLYMPYDERIEDIYQKTSGSCDSSNNRLQLVTDLSEIQAYLPEGHPDKTTWIPKVGDWVVVTDCNTVTPYCKTSKIIGQIQRFISKQDYWLNNVQDKDDRWKDTIDFCCNNYPLRKAEAHEIPKNEVSTINSKSSTFSKKDELLQIAKQKYSKGTVVIGLNTKDVSMNMQAGKVTTLTGIFNFQEKKEYNRKDDAISDQANVYIYSEGLWAEIVPQTQTSTTMNDFKFKIGEKVKVCNSGKDKNQWGYLHSSKEYTEKIAGLACYKSEIKDTTTFEGRNYYKLSGRDGYVCEDCLNLIEENLVGRWVKSLIDFPSGGSVLAGEYGMIRKENISKSFQIDFPSQKDYHVSPTSFARSDRYELMPEGFDPMYVTTTVKVPEPSKVKSKECNSVEEVVKHCKESNFNIAQIDKFIGWAISYSLWCLIPGNEQKDKTKFILDAMQLEEEGFINTFVPKTKAIKTELVEKEQLIYF